VARLRHRSRGWIVLLVVIVAGTAAYHYRPQTKPIPLESVHRPVLAVLIFDNLNQQPDLDFLANAFTREIIAKTGQICSDSFDIIAHHSVVTYRNSRKTLHQIGRELGVDYVLEGGARKDNGRLQVTVRLTRVSDHTQLWKAEFEHDFAETSEIQNDIIARIAATLGVRMDQAEIEAMNRAGTTNAIAREAYLRGVDQCENGTAPGLKDCMTSFEAALQADPEYPRARAALAEAILQSGGSDQKAEKNVRQALALTDAIPQAHTALAEILYRFRHDDANAEKEFRKAIALNRSDENAYLRYSQFLLEKNRLDEAQIQVQRCLSLDPFAVEPNVMAGRILTAARLYDRAIDQLEKAVTMRREDPAIRFYLGQAYLGRSLYDDASHEFQKAVSFGPGVPEYADALEQATAAARATEKN
jgi:TolB-like protein/Tfp pilus assembly protein PilF